MLRKIILVLVLLSAIICRAYPNEFNRLLYSGKWANAKLWLLKNRNQLPREQYYIDHLQVCYFLNEQELCKVYCDSLAGTPGFKSSATAQAAYHLLLSKYYQYHFKPELSIYHGQLSVRFSSGITIPFLKAMSMVRLANAKEYVSPALRSPMQLTAEANNVLKLSDNLPDSLFMYSGRLKQSGALFYFERLRHNPENKLLQERMIALLNESNLVIKRYYAQHPIIVQNYLILGGVYMNTDIDKSLAYHKLAEQMLASINDGAHGILLYLSASLFTQMSKAYEIKYHQTLNPDYLNKAIIWAKQSIPLDHLRQKYEGFYLYRRHVNNNYQPAEESVASLYLTLYKLTRNKNYLDFATRYVEYFRNRPITQVGLEQKTFSVLKQMAEAENGIKTLSEESESYLDNLITQPKYVSSVLKPGHAVITYFSYPDLDDDSIFFLVQAIEHNRQQNFVLSYSNEEMDKILHLHEMVETGNSAEYKKTAYAAYRLILKPVLSALDTEVRHLDIISPAYFSEPLPFEGFLMSEQGSDFKSFDYVFDKYAIGYFTSFTHFLSRQRTPVGVNTVNIWNPDYSRTKLAELTEAPVINRNIVSHYNINLISCRNKKELLNKLLQGEILQVSAHANASFDELERPRIYTGFEGADSVLFDIDLENLTTNTQLVIYAACKSNVGNTQHTGIIDGFTRATLSAGAGGTICSVYEVQESVTTEMLDLFYEKLSEGYSSCEALYLAKKELKKKYPDPKLWQAYIYTGADIEFTRNSSAYSYLVFGISMVLFILVMLFVLKRS